LHPAAYHQPEDIKVDIGRQYSILGLSGIHGLDKKESTPAHSRVVEAMDEQRKDKG
jgi:hypothetical protein